MLNNESINRLSTSFSEVVKSIKLGFPTKGPFYVHFHFVNKKNIIDGLKTNEQNDVSFGDRIKCSTRTSRESRETGAGQ